VIMMLETMGLVGHFGLGSVSPISLTGICCPESKTLEVVSIKIVDL